MAAVVAAHLEPITRFDANDLRAEAPEQALQIPLILQLDQRVTFGANMHSGAAALPGHVSKVADHRALDAELERERRTAEAGLESVVGAWVQADAGAYRRFLPADAAFGRPPRAYGVVDTCSACTGCGKVKCSWCRGKGRNDCAPCFSTGRITCSNCEGSRSVSCPACRGRGRWSEPFTEWRWDESRKENVAIHTNQPRSCDSCSGSGHVSCGRCDYAGKITCLICVGKGHTDCHSCGATGEVNCKPCAASGIVHAWGRVEAEVTRQESLDVQTEDAALAEQVRNRIIRTELPGLGALTGVRNEVVSDGLRSSFRLRLDALHAPLVMAGRSFAFYGFGPIPKVVDFGNIAGHMLAGDLLGLEQALAASGRWGVGAGGKLLEQTQLFVESELNLAIAEQVADLKAKPEAAAQRVELAFKGMVDADYVARAVVALRQAFQRLYGAALWRPLWTLAGLCGAGTVALYVAAGHLAGVWLMPVVVASIGMALWFVSEWLARRRLRSAFPSEVAKRVLGQLRASRSPWRWRGVAALSLAASSFAGLYAAALTPWVQQLHERRATAANLEDHLKTWRSTPVVDLKQRRYPADGDLRRAAERGDARAALILSWKLLLGAAGSPVDLDGAARLLQGIGDQSDALVQTARAALLILRGDASPAALQQAAAQLGRFGDGGMMEARYWEAQIYLGAGSPLRNAPLGLRKLAEASERGHGRAALELGERFARGEDVRRDVARARRLLMHAQSMGVAEATAAMRALP